MMMMMMVMMMMVMMMMMMMMVMMMMVMMVVMMVVVMMMMVMVMVMMIIMMMMMVVVVVVVMIMIMMIMMMMTMMMMIIFQNLCYCTAGYTGDGVSCQEINNCLIKNGGCPAKVRKYSLTTNKHSHNCVRIRCVLLSRILSCKTIHLPTFTAAFFVGAKGFFSLLTDGRCR